MLLISQPTCAQESAQEQRGGLGLQIGTGLLYGGIGALGEYQIIQNEMMRATPIFGLGVSVGGTDSSTAEHYFLGSSAGVLLEFGAKHRFIAGSQIIVERSLYNAPKDSTVHKQVFWGPSGIIGYKGCASFGLMWQVYLGVVYIQNPLLTDKSFFAEPHIGLGLGYKL